MKLDRNKIKLSLSETLGDKEQISYLLPPVALNLMWRALMPRVLHFSATSCAANMAAYGEASSLSALTFIPPVTRAMVSLKTQI